MLTTAVTRLIIIILIILRLWSARPAVRWRRPTIWRRCPERTTSAAATITTAAIAVTVVIITTVTITTTTITIARAVGASASKSGDSPTATFSNQNRYQANQRLHLCIVTIIAEDRPLTALRCIKDMVAVAVIVLPVYNNHT